MFEAAKHLGVISNVVRRLIQERVLPAQQGIPDAAWQIRASDLQAKMLRRLWLANSNSRSASRTSILYLTMPFFLSNL